MPAHGQKGPGLARLVRGVMRRSGGDACGGVLKGGQQAKMGATLGATLMD
jgi:hypothetical protein